MRSHLNSGVVRFVGVLAVVFGLSLELGAWNCPVSWYKQDGLVACWDGYDNQADGTHHETTSVWRDTVAGYEFALTSVTAGDRYLSFNGSTSYGEMKAAAGAAAAFPSGVKTVEIVINLGVSQGIALHGPSTSGVSFGPFNGNILINNKSHDIGYSGPGTAVTNVYATVYGANDMPSKLNLNGAAVSPASAGNYWGGADTSAWLGKRSNGQYPFTGKIFAIRIYNRELSADDIAHNYGVDRYRFFDDDSRFRPRHIRVAPVADQAFTGAEVRPALSVRSDITGEMRELTLGTDYTVVYSNNFALGVATATVTACGDYAGSDECDTVAFNIVPPTDSPVRLVGDFTRQVICPSWSVYMSNFAVTDAAGNPLDPTTYTLSVTNCAATGTATVWAKVTSGPHADAVAVGPLELAVVPAEYMPVAYLASSGDQWVDTGIVPVKATTGVDVRFGQVKNANNQTLFGQKWSWTDGFLFQFNPTFRFDNNKVVDGYADGRDYHVTVAPGGIVTMDYGQGVTTNTGYSNGTCANKTLALFGVNGGGYYATCRIYSFAMSQSGVTVRDLVPVRRLSDNKPGFYDLISTDPATAFLVNKRTGTDFTCGLDAVGFSLGAIPLQNHDPAHASEPVPAIVETATGTALDPQDFALVYANNTAPGYATVTVTGKPGTAYAGRSLSATFGILGRLFVKSTVETEGDGSAWAQAMSLSNALATVAATNVPCEFWLAAEAAIPYPYAVTLAHPLIVRGGFTGTETALSDRVAGAVTTFDGTNTVMCLLTVDSAAGADLTLERIKLCRAKKNGFIKTGNGGLSLYDCEISANGLGANSIYGRGMNVAGGGIGTLVVSNCVYAGNRYASGESNYGGFGIYATAFKSATIDDSLFVTNGFALNSPGAYPWCGYYTRGAAINMIDTPTTIRRSRFAGNCCSVRQSGVGGNWDGGTVFLQGKCGGSLIDHCEFVGNTDRLSYQASAVSYSGALSVYLNAKTDKATVRNCTFAYNVTQGSQSGGGLTVGQGVVDVENSVFWRNERSHVTTLGYGKDIQVHGNGSVKIRHSLVSNLDGTAMAGTNLDYDDTVFAADPLLVTTTADYLNLVTSSASTFYYNTSSLKAMAEMDCHLLSTAGYWRNDGLPGPATEDYSPAIDRGNPASDYSLEPSPNGKCINLGVYGNTPEASKTAVGQPCAVVEMTYPNNMTRPKAVVTMGLAEGSDYSAQVTLVCSTGGVTLAEKAWDGVKKTDVLELMLPFYAPVGADVTATATIVARGATNVVYTTTKAATGGVPAFFGKGGGSHVIHVRQGADCRMNGSDWTDAYPDLATAFKNAPGADKTEVWLSVTNDYLGTTLTLAYPLTIRGGFNGTENSETERAPGVLSVLSADNLYKNLEIDIAAGQLLTIERLKTTKSKGSGIKKGGKGDLLIRECLFTELTTGADGRCLFAAGGNVAVTNCLFVNNVGARESSGAGTGIYLSSCTHASVDDCLFATNGITFASAAGTWYSSAAGAGMYISSTPTVIRNCRFAAIGSAQRYSGDAGIVRFEGASGGSALTNVIIVGNGDVYSYQASSQNGNNGGLVVNMKNATDTLDVKNCTIAYNLTHGSAAAAGLTVRNGAVHVADSIIFGNIRGNKAATGFGADVHASGGSCQLEYCTVTALDETSLTGTALSWDATVAAADPLFVSSLADYTALLDDGASWINCKNANRGAHAALDVHLLSSKGYYRNDGQLGPATESYSPAIDTGNPEADYSREPMPNGGQVNQGAYGNTSEASLTSVGQPEITSGEVTFPNGMARPYVVVQLGIAEGTDFSANVEITCKTGEVVMAQKLFQGQTKTSRIEWLLPFYANVGDRVDALVRVQAKGAAEVLETFYGVAEGAYPIYYGKGGGPNVIHVRPGADCRMDGSDWTDAYPTLQAAFLNGLESGKTEVWLAVTNDYMPATLSVPTSVVFRGGFKGIEGSADAREPGRVSTINGNNHVYQTFAVTVAEGATVTVERVHFTRSKSCGVCKTGAGDFVLRDCQIYNNQNSGRIDGRGFYVSGGVATVTNCQFRLNRGGTELPGYGCGIYLSDCTRATVDDCLFATNGGSFGTCQCTWSGQYNGSAAYVKNTKALFRNCRFTAHGAGQRLTTDGGTVYFCGTSGGSALTNCTLIGNTDFLSYQTSYTGNAGGALVCALSSQAATLDVCNCTIAYNLTQGQYSSAGVNVVSGTVNVRNSIVYGNVRGWRQSADAGADIEVKSGATLNLDYTLLTATNMPSISSAGTLNIAPTCFTANPEFVTSTNDFYKLLTVDANWYHLASGKEGACAALNVHLRGGAGYYDENTGKLVNGYRLHKVGAASPAIDAGDPASDFGREPDVRTIGRAGKRINLGAYGNTHWATMSSVGGAFLRLR